MTKFKSAFMNKSPLYEHGEKLRKEAMRLSKESSGRSDAPDYDNPKVVKLLDQAKKADKSHGSETPANMNSPLDQRYFSADSFYGGDIDIPDLSGAGKVAGKLITPVDEETKDDLKDLVKKIDPIEAHSAKIEKNITDLKNQNTRSKAIQDTTKMKWIPNSKGSTEGNFQRVDIKGNIYSAKPGDKHKKVFDSQAVLDIMKTQKK